MMKLKIKKGDSVKVIAGSGKGYTGAVLAIDTKALRVKVAGHKMMTHFDKENGIQQKEGFIDYSNIALAKKATKAKKKVTKKKAAKKVTKKKTTAKKA